MVSNSHTSFTYTSNCHSSFQEEIFASSFAAAAYLKSIDFPKDKKVFTFLIIDVFMLSL